MEEQIATQEETVVKVKAKYDVEVTKLKDRKLREAE